MANWITTLKLTPEWEKAASDELPLTQMAKVIAVRLRALTIPEGDLADKRDEIADEFEFLSIDEDLDSSDFNAVMSELYDWADTRVGDGWPGEKICWVETMR